MTSTITMWEGGGLNGITEEALARLFEDPRGSWGNCELAVERTGGAALVYCTAFGRDRGAVRPEFVIMVEGASPIGRERPGILTVLDGGGEPFRITARHLLGARDASWLVWQLGQSDARPTHWPDGRPMVWSVAAIDDEPWKAVGELDEPYLEDTAIELFYGYARAEDDEGEDDEGEDDGVDEADGFAPHRNAEPTDRTCCRLAARALTDDEAEVLPQTALWPVLVQLFNVTDPRWLSSIARAPMPWLRTLEVELDDLEDLGAAVRQLPRLVELQVSGDADAIPAFEAPQLRELVLGINSGAAIDAFLRAAKLPALRGLGLYGDALTTSIDVSALPERAIVYVDLQNHSIDALRNLRGARALALALAPEHTVEELLDVLAARAERDTILLGDWEDAESVVAEARARGIRLRME